MDQLAPYYEDLIDQYLRFSRLNRTQAITELNTIVSDEKESRLVEEVYTPEDVEDIFTSLWSILKSEVQSELKKESYTVVGLLRQLFVQADKLDLQLKIDTSALEKTDLLSDIGKRDMKKSSMGGMGRTALAPMKHTGKDLNAIQELNTMKEELKITKDRLQQTQQQCTSVLLEKTAIGDELRKTKDEVKRMQELAKSQADALNQSQNMSMFSQLQQQVASLQADMQGKAVASTVNTGVDPEIVKTQQTRISELEGEVKTLREQLDLKSAECHKLESEMTSKVSATAPFRNLQKMLAKKSTQIKELREELKKQSPQTDSKEVSDSDSD